MSEKQLKEEIIALSNASEWEAARDEWKLYTVYEADSPDTCLCGHNPIIEICVLRNKVNGGFAKVGNCCVKKFMGLPSDLIFQAVKRVRKDSTKSLNSEALAYAVQKGWINQWEHDFYKNTMTKRVLTTKQAAKKLQVNTSFLNKLKASAAVYAV